MAPQEAHMTPGYNMRLQTSLDTVSSEQRPPEAIINGQTVKSTEAGLAIILPRRGPQLPFQLQHLITIALKAQEHMCLTSG